jgi:hypothetical protein
MGLDDGAHSCVRQTLTTSVAACSHQLSASVRVGRPDRVLPRDIRQQAEVQP